MTATVRLQDIQLPHRRQEAWKYTDLSQYARHLPDALSLANSDAAAAMPGDSLLGATATQIVFVDGEYQAQLSDPTLTLAAQSAAPDWDPGLDSLLAATPASAYRLRISQSPAQAVHLLFSSSRDADCLHRVHLDLELDPGVEVTILEEHLGGRQGIALTSIDTQLAEDSQAHWLRIQHAAPAHTLLARLTADIGPRARLHQVHVEWGARLSRLDATLRLAGTESRLDYFALSGLKDRQHVDHQVQVRHDQAHGTSRLRARGIIADAARQVFNGKVFVARHAQKTDSDQLLRNLLLSDRAEVDAKPELEIYADDVRCAHGSTVGRLDEQALFYLRSRGLELDEARRMLMVSFAEHILTEIADESLRDTIRGALADHLSLMTAR